MLQHSFLHLPSVGSATERKIWRCGIASLDDFLNSPPGFIAASKAKELARHIHRTRQAITARNARYFRDKLPSKEHWRIFREFRPATAYLDIETTGLERGENIITTIAHYDGCRVRCYVNGSNLDDFRRDIGNYEVIVSFNGKSFDIPFIESWFGIRLPQAHLDLRHILKSLGYSGGLKACERQLGIGREGELVEVDGFFAVRLWHDYRRHGRRESLATLLAYNIEDVLSLEYLMIEAYNRKIKELPLFLEPLPMPSPPANPFAVDAATVRRLRIWG